MEKIFGLIKDFSRDGLRVVFDKFESEPDSQVNIKVQRPNKDLFVPASVQVRWKRFVGDKWEVGFRIRDFVAQAKAEILEYGYKSWLQERGFST